ncbi:hypothetical protein [Fodinicola acaciae]|uniref:hypothetical protein n=1 Tax=Fodinicola acaciae TaxID=2681555 RepID=UPI0013D09236|nr:hypothetical protein [Fodinicola acaciae]
MRNGMYAAVGLIAGLLFAVFAISDFGGGHSDAGWRDVVWMCIGFAAGGFLLYRALRARRSTSGR